ncbi:MAG: cellulose binding domain-containing protein, partial [Pirellulales bacterium]
MTTWTLRSLFGMGGDKGSKVSQRLRQQRDRHWRKRRAARDQFAAEPLEQRAMMAVVAPAYEVTQDWGSGFEAGIELQNLDTEAVNDWTVSFDYAADISSIWNAAIVARDGDRYTIENAGWNADLAAGQTVAFGFIGAGDSSAPTNFLINGEPIDGLPSQPDPIAPEPVDPSPVVPEPADPAAPTGSLSADFSVVSDWGSGFTGEVTVRNAGDATLEGWNVSFD